jgi:hypothetical protein
MTDWAKLFEALAKPRALPSSLFLLKISPIPPHRNSFVSRFDDEASPYKDQTEDDPKAGKRNIVWNNFGTFRGKDWRPQQP